MSMRDRRKLQKGNEYHDDAFWQQLKSLHCWHNLPPGHRGRLLPKLQKQWEKNPTNVWVLYRQKLVNTGNNKAKLSLVALHCTGQCSTQSFLRLSQRWLLKEICQGPVCGLIGRRAPELGSNVVRQFRGQGVHWGREKGIDDTGVWMYRPKMQPSQVSSTELPL